MSSYFSTTATIYIFFSLCSWRGLARDIKKPKVLLTNNGPTTIGGDTNFSAEVVNCPGTKYWYCWQTSNGSDCHTHTEPKISKVFGSWTSTGRKDVTLTVERMVPLYRNCGRNTTFVVVTDTINAKLTVSPQPHAKSYFVGAVNLSVQVHDPSHLFDPDDITYLWNFNDSTEPVVNHLKKMTYNFTEDRVYIVSVFITAHALGKLYNGTLVRTLHFKVNFSPTLQVYNLRDRIPLPKLKLAPSTKKRIYVALGQVELIVAYNNPYSLVKNVTTGWKFTDDGQSFPHSPGNKISHNYIRVEDTSFWATPEFVTPNRHSSIPLFAEILVQEPVTDLIVTSNNSLYTTKRDLQVNVTCKGSEPFQMCWKLFKKSQSPLFDNCSSLSQDCYFHINYTIPYSGSYTLDVFVLNYVSSVNHIQYFTIPGPTPKPTHNTAAKTASAVVPATICVIIVVFVLLFVAKKVYSNRHHSVLETADFDFRDEDSRSLDSFLVDNKCCHSFRFCRRFSRKKEAIPLLEDWGRSKESTPLYSAIL